MCSGDEKQMVYQAFFLEAQQTVWQCTDCGMVYACSPPIDYVNDSIYGSPLTYGTIPDKLAHYRQIASRLARMFPWTAAITEIGCATGGLLKALRQEGFTDVSGFDLSPVAAENCRNQGFPTSSTTLRPDNDIVVLSHVLEHAWDIRGLLRQAKAALKPGGFLYVEVPDADRYANFKAITLAFNLEHINHFQRSSLVDAIVQAGFDPLLAEIGEIPYVGERYPVIWTIAAKRMKPTYDNRFLSALDRRTQALLTRVNALGEVAVWGLGQLAQRIFSASQVKVVAATDSNPVFYGRLMLGVCVVPPEEFRPDARVPVLVCTELRQAEIVERIRSLGLTNAVVTLD